MFFKKIFIITKLTILELISEKIIFSFGILFAIFLSFFGFLNYFNPQEQIRFLQDLGITFFSFFSFLMVLFGGTAVFNGEKKIDSLWLSKPIRRFEYFLGRIYAVKITLLVGFLAMATFLGAVLFFRFQHLDLTLLSVFYLLILKYLIFLFLIVFISTFLDRFMTIFLGAVLFFFSNAIVFLESISLKLTHSFQAFCMQVFKVILPRFDFFNLTHVLTYGDAISGMYLIKVTVYCCAYSLVILSLAIFIFSKKEF